MSDVIQSPVVEVAEAVANTAANPSPETIIADIELIASLIVQLRAKLGASHPSLTTLLKAFL